MALRRTHPGPGDGYIRGHRACWHKIKTCQAPFGAAAPINHHTALVDVHLLVMPGDLFAVQGIKGWVYDPILLSRCPLSAKLISWTPCWAFLLGISSCICHLKYTCPCGGGRPSCICSWTSSTMSPSTPFFVHIQSRIQEVSVIFNQVPLSGLPKPSTPFCGHCKPIKLQ